MPYKPTGKPPGRPRKVIETPAVIEDRDELDGDEPQEDIARITVAPGLGGLCGHCYPDGWPAGATGLGCLHGSWTRLATGFVN